jgi:hypothetical protein
MRAPNTAGFRFCQPPGPVILKVTVVYVYAPHAGQKYKDYCLRFLDSYQNHPPGLGHHSVVVLNGAPTDFEMANLFSVLPDCDFLLHDDSGWDIGGYQLAAMIVPCDLMVFFSGSAYFKKSGWLKRMVAAYEKHGAGLYGAMGNRGDSIPTPVNVHPHIRTTGFWMDPELLNQYPSTVTTQAQRYPFEHGPNCLTGWVKSRGLKTLVVSWSGEYKWEMWDAFPNGYHRGDQSDVISYDRICDPPFYTETK